MLAINAALPYDDTKALAEKLYEPDEFPCIYSRHVYDVIKEEDFAFMYSHTGRPGVSAVLLAHSLVIAAMKNLPDRDIAEEVRSNIGTKFALHLPLDYKGFHFDDLSAFRQRLIEHNAEKLIFRKILDKLYQLGLIKSERQRTDSTWILARGRKMKRYETVGYAIRNATNAILEAKKGDSSPIKQEIENKFEKYKRIKGLYKASEEEVDQKLRETIKDAIELLEKVKEDPSIINLEEVKMLKEIVNQQIDKEEDKDSQNKNTDNNATAFEDKQCKVGLKNNAQVECIIPDQQINQKEDKDKQEKNADNNSDSFDNQQSEVKLKSNDKLKDSINNPFDPEIRIGRKNDQQYFGVMVHIRATIPDNDDKKGDVKIPSIITEIETVPANMYDGDAYKKMLEKSDKKYSPEEEYVDSAYISGENLCLAQQHGITLHGVPQRHQEKVFGADKFKIENGKAICLAGKESIYMSQYIDKASGQKMQEYGFSRHDCKDCCLKQNCTTAEARRLKIGEYYQYTQMARLRAKNKEYVKEVNKKRSPIEATISEFVHNNRRSRYFGIKKISLANIMRACAINIKRFVNYIAETRGKIKPSTLRQENLVTALAV